MRRATDHRSASARCTPIAERAAFCVLSEPLFREDMDMDMHMHMHICVRALRSVQRMDHGGWCSVCVDGRTVGRGGVAVWDVASAFM